MERSRRMEQVNAASLFVLVKNFCKAFFSLILLDLPQKRNRWEEKKIVRADCKDRFEAIPSPVAANENIEALDC